MDQEETDAVEPEECGRVIREAREHAGLSQKELARRLGVTQQAVSRWERGQVDVRWRCLGRISVALGLSRGTLMGLARSRRSLQ